MITKITVDGFKSLADFGIELGQVNVLIGANGSGKTNILEAIGVLSAAARGRLDDEALHRRGVRLSGPGRYVTRLSEVPSGPTVSMKAEWQDDGATATYELVLEPPANGNVWRYVEERAWESDQLALDRASAANGLLDPEVGWAALKRVELASQSSAKTLLGRLETYGVYAATTPALRDTVSDPQQREPLGLSGGGLAEAVWLLRAFSGNEVERYYPPDLFPTATFASYFGQVLSDALGLVDWASELGVEERSAGLLGAGVPSGRLVLFFRDRFMDPRWQKLGAYECSEGALYILLAAVLAARVLEPWLFAMDDFDHALNPRLARALVEHFCGWVIDNPVPRQVLITTHNPLILDGLDLTDDRIRLFAVERTSKGRTVAERVLVDDRLLARAKEGWTLSRLWVMGEIGGVPSV